MKKIFASPTTRFLSLFLVIAMLVGVFAACTTGIDPADTTVGETNAETDPVTGGDTVDDMTDAPTDPAETEPALSETETEAETESETVDNSQRVNEPTDPALITFYNNNRNRSIFSDPNQCGFEIVMDETYGSVLKLTTKKGASDPYISFNYANYMKLNKLDPINADEYKYMVYTIRVENVACESFEMFYYAGAVTGPTPGYQMTASFDGTNTGWQKIIFDLSEVDFSGVLNGMRWDFLTTASGTNDESVYIYSIQLCKTREEAMGSLDIDMTRPGEGSDLTEAPVEGVNYDKVNAPDEDASVDFWFDHMTEKLYQNDTTSSGMDTYVIHMAGNSIENCQFFVAPQADRSFIVSLTDFADGKGNTLRTEVLREHYVNINGNMVPDALPPLDGAVTVKGGNSQGFVIKVWADTNETAGLYTAELKITDADSGKIIKIANVYTYVYDFSLSDETALKTSVGLGDWDIVSSYWNREMKDVEYWDLYKIYYDFLLENRLCAYRLPYNLTDGRVTEYLNNPRVNSFVINRISENESEAYGILSQNESWMKKGFYYYVDEPTNMGLMNEIVYYSNRLEGNFPGYRQISPFFTNFQLDENTDQIEFLKPYLKIWCTKPFAFTPRDKYMIPGTQFMTTSAQEKQYGTFAERMAALAKQGHETWLYVCWEPGQPYVNWLALGDGTEPVVSSWQCKMTDSVGMLYWSGTYWTADPMNNLTPLVGAASHGDGVLLYSGAQIGSYEPISSFRLENVRIGIQDYQLLTMLEAGEGEAAADEMVAMVTTDVITYTNDDDYLRAVRVLLFEKVSAMLKK
ncbi:MAG: DUF4091 domain-containing protein [Clostridia bacterium]|nr:DUF4091 domain-containing protein [Clostridia bacterium]